MDVSSTNSKNDATSVQLEALKKSIDVSQRAVLKVLESSLEQSQYNAAQKTGLGTHLNIKG